MMNTLSDAPLFAAALTALAGVVLVGSGILLGVLVARRRVKQSTALLADRHQSEEFAQSLLQWTNSLVGDVDHCFEEIAQIQQGVLNADCDLRQSPELLVDMMSRMIEANTQMRQRLSLAEGALADQAKRIASTLNEARTDALTGLPNRRMFDEELSRRHAEFKRYGTAYTLLLFDIDHFKKFNDTYGHLAGDEVLKHIARTVGHTLRETDILARTGGEEFAVIFAATKGRDSHLAADRVRAAVEATNTSYEDQSLIVTISCGLAEPNDVESEEDLLRRSDEALYASKNAGRNCVHLHDGWRCTPLTRAPRRAPAENCDSHAGTSEADLSAACDAVRQRLLEVTGCD